MRRMLIVEDDLDVNDCLQQFFQSRGFAVEAVYSGEEAMGRLQDAIADVVLLDVMLPGLSGIEVLKHVKTLVPQAQVVMVTAVDQGDVREQAFRYGACAYITKPFDFSERTWAPVLDRLA